MLVLASNSPRRQMLLSLQGWQFEVHPTRVDESPFPDETPKDYVLRLASEKSLSASREGPADRIVIGADTAVVDGDRILGKPADPFEAEAMLLSLQGRTHQVITGLAVCLLAPDRLLTDWCVTQVTMRQYSHAEVRAYVASGDPIDKAGAYAIQHELFNPVERITGCYANVVGLPLCHLTKLLQGLNLDLRQDLTRDCLAPEGYNCQLVEMILKNS